MRSRFFAQALVIAVVTLMSLALGRAVSDAESTGELQFVSLRHATEGLIEISFASSSDEPLPLDALDVYIDDTLVRIESPPTLAIDPVSALIAIDTSGSMFGAPLAAAKVATVDLIAGLDDQDRVGLLAFADSPTIVAGLSADRAEVEQGVASLRAQGSTALYSAVVEGARILGSVDDGPRALILLSDGEDFGGVSGVGREESLAAAVDAGIVVFAFALGAEADGAYLAALANSTGGSFSVVADNAALASLFADLGRRLGTTYSLRAAAPPLSQGRHQIRLSVRNGEETLDVVGTFEVTNEGLLSVATADVGSTSTLIAIQIELSVEIDGFEIEAIAAGQTLEFRRETSTVLLNPWLFDPGALEVQVNAYVDDSLAGATTIVVEIPALDPQLEIADSPDDASFVVIGRAQGVARPTLVVRRNGEEFAREEAASHQVVIRVPHGDIVAELLSSSGATLQTESADPPAIVEPSEGVSVVLVAGGLLAAAVLIFGWLGYLRYQRVED